MPTRVQPSEWKGIHHEGNCSTLLQTMKSGSSGAEASSLRNIAIM